MNKLQHGIKISENISSLKAEIKLYAGLKRNKRREKDKK